MRLPRALELLQPANEQPPTRGRHDLHEECVATRLLDEHQPLASSHPKHVREVVQLGLGDEGDGDVVVAGTWPSRKKRGQAI